MAGTLNKVMLIGNLGKDPEVRRFENGGMLVKFPIATTENFTDREGNRKENTEWHTVVVRSPRLAEVCERFLHKGDKVFIEGKIRSRQWTDEHNQTRYNIEISADSMTMLGPNPMRGREDEYGGGARKGGHGGNQGGTSYRSNQTNSSFVNHTNLSHGEGRLRRRLRGRRPVLSP
ncbi:MAG: single-stranded DNA-binding protein [Schleiferiaceae bacterium]